MASKKLSSDTSLANSYKLSRGVASVARPSAPTIGTATDGGTGNMSVTFTASTLGPTASSFSLTSSSGVTGSGASSPLTLQEVATGTYTYSVSGVNANGTGPSSAASNSVVVASVTSPSYDSIASTTLGSTTASITFSSIPATYTHLQIRGISRCNRAVSYASSLQAQFNGDTGSNYWQYHYMYANGATLGAGSGDLTTQALVGYSMGSSATANTFEATIIDILDYKSTNKYKTIRSLDGGDTNGAGGIQFMSSSWMTTSAITSITIFPTTAFSFLQYSSFALYGVK